MNKLIIIIIMLVAVTIKLTECHRAIHPPVPGLPINTDRTSTKVTTTTPAPKGPFLLDNYLAPSMQALAYYIELLQYEPSELTTLEPPFMGWEAEGGTTYKPPPTSPRPSTTTKSSTVWWKPPSTHSTVWWVPPSTTPRTTTTKPTTTTTTKRTTTTTTTRKPIITTTTNYPTTPWWQTTKTTTASPQRTTTATTTTTIKPVTWWQPPEWWTSTSTTEKPIIRTTTTMQPLPLQPTPSHRPGLYAPLPPFYSRPQIPPIQDSLLYNRGTTKTTKTTKTTQTTKTTPKWQSNTSRPSKTTTTQKWQSNTSKPASITTTQKWQSNTNRPARTTTTQKWQSNTSKPAKITTTQKWQSNTNRPARTTTTQKWQSNTNKPAKTTTTPFTSITSDKNFFSWFFQQKAKVFKPEFEYDFNLLDPLPGALIHDIIYERSELPAISDKDNVNYFLRVYDDNFGRAHSNTGKKRIPITKPYVEYLMLYDLLKRDAKAMNLSKYEGYTEKMLHELAELSTRSAERQLHALLTRMLLRNDVERTDVVNRVKGIIKDLENPDSITAKAMRYFHPLPFVP